MIVSRNEHEVDKRPTIVVAPPVMEYDRMRSSGNGMNKPHRWIPVEEARWLWTVVVVENGLFFHAFASSQTRAEFWQEWVF